MSSVQRSVMGPAITHTYSEGPGRGEEVCCAVLTTQQQYLSTTQHHSTLLLRGKFLRFNKLVEKYFQNIFVHNENICTVSSKGHFQFQV